VSKLEPHVLGGSPPDDVDLFLADLDDEARFVKGAAPVSEEALESSTSDEDQTKEGFIRLADFLKRKLPRIALHNYPRSIRARAIMSYRHQKDLCSGEAEPELVALSQIDKVA
jgi:hypothetical protein